MILDHDLPSSPTCIAASTFISAEPVNCLREQIASLYDDLYAANATLRRDEEAALRIEAENRKLKARIYLATARQDLQSLEEAENKKNEEMQKTLEKVAWALSTRVRQYKDLISQNKQDNARLIAEIRTFPDDEGDSVPKTKNISQKIQTIMIRHLPFSKLSLRRRRRGLMARSA